MKNVISGISTFHQELFPEFKEKFEALANGQAPEVLMITCADSRIDPNLITQTAPGDLFVCRNAGNIVPPHTNETTDTGASIEFAVTALGVSHIVVCGHTDCGAMKGAIQPEKLDSLPQVKSWLGNCCAATEIVRAKNSGKLTMDHLQAVTEENIILQLQHLKLHPAVAAKLATGKVQLHGWLYNIGNGEILAYDESKNTFEPVSEYYKSLFASRTTLTA
jgi:carbonic anhydrase